MNILCKIFSLGKCAETTKVDEAEEVKRLEHYRGLTPKKIDKLFELYRDYLKHEDNLVNHRLTWLVSVQSFLIATFGFSYQKKFEVISQAILDSKLSALENTIFLYDWFLFFLVLIGLGTSFSAWRSVSAAVRAINRLKLGWKKIIGSQPQHYHLPDITGGGDEKASDDGVRLSLGLPRFFLFFWLVILCFVGAGAWYNSVLLKAPPTPTPISYIPCPSYPCPSYLPFFPPPINK